MSARVLLGTALLCLLPISELRGGLPYALAHDVPLPVAFLVSVAFNAATIPLTFAFLSTAHRLLESWRLYARVFERIVGRARRRVARTVERHGRWGLVLFVGIPLPITGAYTGALGAWVLGMPLRRAFAPICAGVLLAAVIVTLVYYAVITGGHQALRIFIKG